MVMVMVVAMVMKTAGTSVAMVGVAVDVVDYNQNTAAEAPVASDELGTLFVLLFCCCLLLFVLFCFVVLLFVLLLCVAE